MYGFGLLPGLLWRRLLETWYMNACWDQIYQAQGLAPFTRTRQYLHDQSKSKVKTELTRYLEDIPQEMISLMMILTYSSGGVWTLANIQYYHAWHLICLLSLHPQLHQSLHFLLDQESLATIGVGWLVELWRHWFAFKIGCEPMVWSLL